VNPPRFSNFKKLGVWPGETGILVDGKDGRGGLSIGRLGSCPLLEKIWKARYLDVKENGACKEATKSRTRTTEREKILRRASHQLSKHKKRKNGRNG